MGWTCWNRARDEELEMEQYEVIIVGGGPAGLAAGLYTSRAKQRSLLIEGKWPGGQLRNTELIEDYPGFESIKGAELADRMESQVRKLGLEFLLDNVICIRPEGIWKRVQTENGKEFLAKAVIVTSGGEPRRLGVPGEEELAGRGVSYCAICDGAFFQDQVVAVVGGGDSAVEEAAFLTRFASKVYLLHRRSEFRAQSVAVERAMSNPKIEIMLDTEVETINGTDEVESLSITRHGESQKLAVSGVFIFVGFMPNTELFCGHVEHDPRGYIVTNSSMETSVSGIYAAGDVRAQLARQITTAVGDGTTAAIAAGQFIESFEE
jgi:thioredoxin reductase (NADPH)